MNNKEWGMPRSIDVYLLSLLSDLCSENQNNKFDYHQFYSSSCNWRAQSKNDPLIFRPFLKVSTCQNSTTSEHFQKWPKNQGIVLALIKELQCLTVKK